MSRTIIVAIDFSKESIRALKEALSIARRLEVGVQMVHVVADFEVAKDIEALHEFDKLRRVEIDQELSSLQTRFSDWGVKLSNRVVDGSPGAVLCRLAEEVDCEMMVIGAHGRVGFPRYYMGSVADRITRNAPCDVLIARGGGRRDYRRILVPVDFSIPAKRAVDRAIELATKEAEIDLFHVWELPGRYQHAPYSTYPKALKEITAHMREKVDERAAPLLATYRRDHRRIEFDSARGSPGPSIINQASGYDLIVLGGRQERENTHPVASSVLRFAPCSVLRAWT